MKGWDGQSRLRNIDQQLKCVFVRHIPVYEFYFQPIAGYKFVAIALAHRIEYLGSESFIFDCYCFFRDTYV